ncbi:MAG TPA: DedA family protein [Opitutaceae bacterium]|nr:DedA family protein [Opitutaceae bacterium]
MHDLLQRLVASYQHSLQTGGYPYIVFLMALESSVVPLPSEVVIPPAVILVAAGQSTMTLRGIVIAAAIGSWLGSSVLYWIARVAGRPLVVKYGALVFIPPDKVERAERWSQRFGSFGIFLSRMLPVVRHLIGIPAGIVRVNYWKFSLYTILGSLIWCGVLTYVSFIAGKDERLMHGEIREVTLWATGAATILGAAYYFLVHRLSRRPA